MVNAVGRDRERRGGLAGAAKPRTAAASPVAAMVANPRFFILVPSFDSVFWMFVGRFRYFLFFFVPV